MHRPLRRIVGSLTLLALGLLATSCRRAADPAVATPEPTAPKLTRVTVQLDWIPEPEHGGFYQAEARGFFRAAGLDVVLLPGGPNAFALQKIATGQADIAQQDSTNVLLAIAEGLPVIHIGAVFQNDPSVLMLHADNPVSRFEDLNGKTIMARPEWAFIPYLKKKYGIDFKLIPQNFSVANFVGNRDFIQQGYYIAEPFHIVRGGAQPPKFLYAWDAGFDAYTVLAANRPWVEKNPETARIFLAAYIRGWNDYLQGDPTAAHALMKQGNPNASDEFLAFSREQIIRERLVTGRKPSEGDLTGRVTEDRFRTQILQLEELGILPAGKLSVDRVVRTDLLPPSRP
jgi:NitT/TauT family transport system substrate-binding protein